MQEIKYKFEKFSIDIELSNEQLKSLEIKPHPLVSDWAEDNLSLTGSYLDKGPLKLKQWQVQILNSPLLYDEVYWLGPTRTGKSLLGETFAYYCQGEMKLDGMLVYPESTTAEHRFSETIKPMIEHNEVLRNQWNGDDKMLTVKRIRLDNCTWRIASAQNKNDIASFSAPISICSEVGKWEKQKKFNPKQLIKGRQGDSHHKGFMKMVFETTPYEIGDYMFQEVYSNGIIILHPFYPCPHCGVYHEYVDEQIKVRSGEFKTSASIKKNKTKAVYYECVNCKREITELDRAEVDHLVVWAAPEIKMDGFHQDAEIIKCDGTIDGVMSNGYRKDYIKVCYQWNRGVDINYQFWKWLAEFFECKDDPVKLKSYQNEVNAVYYSQKNSGVNISYILSRCGGYLVKGDSVIIPDDVLVVTLGIDTHDDNFTYCFVGWCKGVVWKVLKHGIIPCDMKQQEFKDPINVYNRLKTELFSEKMYWPNGFEVTPACTFQDRGGHRSVDVDYICSKLYRHYAYVGLTRVDYTKDVVYESNNGPYYLGQTEQLSELTSIKINSDSFYIPDDYHSEFPRQIIRQFFIKRINPDGSISKKWIHGGDDHFRDCLNLNECAGRILGLDKILIDEKKCDALYEKRDKMCRNVTKNHVDTNNKRSSVSNQNIRNNRPGGYSRVFGRR